MTRNEANVKLAAVLATLAEVDFAPESILYLGCGANLTDWATLKTLLAMSGLMTCEHNECRITDAGRKMVDAINQAKGK